jgi:hypothetical protein
MSKQVVKLKLVEVDVPVQKRDGGTYQASQITYEVDGQTRTKAIHNTVLKNNEELQHQFNALADTKMPIMVELNTVKTDDGFVNLVGITPATEQEQYAQESSNTPTQTKPSQTPNYSSNKKSSYKADPNKEESIVRAVALKAAVETSKGTPEEILKVAEFFATWLRG